MSTLPIRVVGLISIDTHSCGLLHFTCLEECTTQTFFGTRFHGSVPYEADQEVSKIPAGSRFYAHPSHIRAITMAPKEKLDAKEK